MKAATGELSLTVITFIMIGAILTFMLWIWPLIQNSLANMWNNIGESGNGDMQTATKQG